MNDWARIREHYRRNTTAIYSGGRDDWGIDPYAWDDECGIVLTPIESALWEDIRQAGAVLYPQYPVAGFFVDFGNPVARIAIECDGAAFHTDRAKDARRQSIIESNGWTMYRFTGRECKKDGAEQVDALGRTRLIVSDTAKQIRTIAERHRIRYSARKVAA